MEGLTFVYSSMHGSEFVNRLFTIFTLLGDGGLIWLVICIFLLCNKKTRVSGLVMLISLALGHVFNENILKLIITRPRPFNVCPEFKDFIASMGVRLPSSFSFPSGHSFSSFNCAMVLTLFNKKNAIYAYPLAALIAFSRIFMLIHYPTDVLAGAVLGTLFAIMTFALYRLVLKKIDARKRGMVRA